MYIMHAYFLYLALNLIIPNIGTNCINIENI